MSLKETTFLGLKWSAAGTLGASVFQLLQIAVLTRFLPKEAFGLVAMALFVVQFSNVFADMGMSSAILYKQKATPDEYSSLYWFNILISLLLYGMLMVLSPFIADFYNEPELRILIPVMGINILIMASGRMHRTIMQKLFLFKAISLIELISFFTGFVTAIVLVLFDFGVYSLVYATLIGSLISNLLFLTRNIRLNPIHFHFRLNETTTFLKVGGYSTGSVLLDFFSRETDVLIIGKMLGAEQLGVYSLAKQLVVKVYTIVNPIIINVLNPVLSSLQNDKNLLKQYALKAVYILATVNFPIYLLLIVVSGELLSILYGADYAPGYLILSFFAISYATHSINNPAGSLQIATGRTNIGLYWSVMRVVASTVVILFAARYSTYIVAGAMALLQLIFVIPLWYIQFRPLAGIRLSEYLKQFGKVLFFFLLVSAVAFLFPIASSSVVTIIALGLFKAGVASLFFAGLVYLFDRERFNYAFHLLKIVILRK